MATSGSTFFELRWSHRPIFVVRSNRSLRPCLIGASSPKITPHLVWGLVGALTVPPLAPLPLPARPRSPPPPLALPFRCAQPSPALRLPTCTAHIPRVPPTSCTPRPGPHTVVLAAVTWRRRRRDDHDRTIAMASSWPRAHLALARPPCTPLALVTVMQ
jgi:hypothetical protein